MKAKKKPKTEFTMSALTPEEKNVFSALFELNGAASKWEIYLEYVGKQVAKLISYCYDGQADDAPKDRMKESDIILHDLGKFYGNWDEDIFYDTKSIRPSGNKANIRKLVKYVAKIHKEFRINIGEIPSSVKIDRMIDDFVSEGWIQVRTNSLGKAKALYYLDDRTREKIKPFAPLFPASK